MTREEIMLIAEEAGVRLASYSDTVDQRNVYPHELERFAKLIREREREACAKFIEDKYARQFVRPWREHLAASIRARNDK